MISSGVSQDTANRGQSPCRQRKLRPKSSCLQLTFLPWPQDYRKTRKPTPNIPRIPASRGSSKKGRVLPAAFLNRLEYGHSRWMGVGCSWPIPLFPPLTVDKGPGVAGDHEFLVCRNDEDFYPRIIGADDRFLASDIVPGDIQAGS